MLGPPWETGAGGSRHSEPWQTAAVDSMGTQLFQEGREKSNDSQEGFLEEEAPYRASQDGVWGWVGRAGKLGEMVALRMFVTRPFSLPVSPKWN